MFPTFNDFFMMKAEELHLSHNNISAWPNSTIWDQYAKITYVDIRYNPVCHLPTLQKHVQIDISPCKYKIQIVLIIIKYSSILNI